MEFLAQNRFRELADTLPDIPQHVIAIHSLHTGRCRAMATGDLASAAVIDPSLTDGELVAWGSDPDKIADFVCHFENWDYVEVPPELADPVAAALEKRLHAPPARLRDLYHVLTSPPPAVVHPAVRLLTTPADADLYSQSAAIFHDDPEDARRNVLEGPVAAAIVDGKVVGSVEANVRTSRYANMCAEFHTDFRGRGLCTACAALAARAVQDIGLIPVWSAAESNTASLRVAQKVGYVEVAHWVYLENPRAQKQHICKN